MIDPFDEMRVRLGSLNSGQRESVDAMQTGWAGSADEFILPVVEGPPGTGKTTVGVLGATQYIHENPRGVVAYFAFTNYAAAKAKEEFERLHFGSDSVVQLISNPAEANWARGVVAPGYRFSDLIPDQIRRLSGARVLISTLHSSNLVFQLAKRPLVVIDEFSQVSPTLFFHSLSRACTLEYNPRGYVLLGDPDQLPVITTQPDLRPNIGTFLLGRKGDIGSHRLDVQYRMNNAICSAVNALREALHSGYPLRAGDDSVASRTLTTLGWEWNGTDLPPTTRDVLDPRRPLVFVNTDSIDGWERAAFGESKYFPEEAQVAAYLARKLGTAYRDSEGRGLQTTLLSPYNAQVQEMRTLIGAGPEDRCLTVYKAQGREYDAVIVSFVRKNPARTIGFLDEPQLRSQTYVACSRGRAKLIVLFSQDTFGGYPDFGALLDRCSSIATQVEARDLWGEMQ